MAQDSIQPTFIHQGVSIPRFWYGTAWKEAQTQACVEAALKVGFRAIDTANQRKHYYEAGVGAALKTAYAQGLVQRKEIFLQTKFTFQAGQDHRLPYDPHADYETQVHQSLASSLEHLATSFIDSYILHGPSSAQALHTADWQVWRAMEKLQRSGQVRFLGVSNINPWQLQELLDRAEVKPTFVQNRCFARLQWDAAVRALCQRYDMYYQGFSLLTANPEVLHHPSVKQMAQKYQATPAQIIFRFALQLGILPLTGTTQVEHMRQDLAVFSFVLTEEEVHHIQYLAL